MKGAHNLVLIIKAPAALEEVGSRQGNNDL